MTGIKRNGDGSLAVGKLAGALLLMAGFVAELVAGLRSEIEELRRDLKDERR